MAAPVVPNLIVNELLDKHNYKEWCVRVKTYLTSQGLGSFIEEANGVPPKRKIKREAWIKGNAETLHVIHLCCGTDAFEVIKKKKLPHEAWDALERFGRFSAQDDERADNIEQSTPPLMSACLGQWDINEQSTPVMKASAFLGEPETIFYDAQLEVAEADDKADEVETVDEGNNGEDSIPEDVCEDLFRNAKHCKWNSVMKILEKHPTAVSEAAPNDYKKTVLHYAVKDMKADTVRRLMPLIKDEDVLDQRDSDWCTALEYCYVLPDNNEMFEIAKCLVQKKNELNAGGTDIEYPVLLLEALERGRPKLADYLFELIRFETREDQFASGFISFCFNIKRFDIACKLISQRPEFGIAEDFSRRVEIDEDFSPHSPLNELACTPSAFLSGSRLKFWEKWIYHVISIESSVKRLEAKYAKGKPTAKLHTVSGEVQPEEDGKGRHSNADHTTVEVSADVSKDKKDGHSGLGFFRNFSWCLNVPALFQGSTIQHVCKIFGISHIYEMQVSHSRVLEILVCMCKVLTKKKKEEHDTKKTDEFVEAAMFQAIEGGLVEFLKEILKVHPHLSSIKNRNEQNLLQAAVVYRQPEVFNLIHGFIKDNMETMETIMSMKDDDGNNMLHMMGILSPSSETYRIRGAALQMQNELEWFEVLCLMASPADLKDENKKFKTPGEYFYENHAEMKKEGEKSMKDTATSCTVVGALMVTMMFAVAFTLPAPLQENSTLPPLLYRSAFRVFIIADAISLFSSLTSVVLFMGILTARYAFDDFRTNLPRKMILGLATLFISVAAMVIVFASALFIILPADTRIALPVTLVAAIPVFSFLWMQLPFVVDIFHSTYMRRLFDKKVLVKPNKKVYFTRVQREISMHKCPPIKQAKRRDVVRSISLFTT